MSMPTSACLRTTSADGALDPCLQRGFILCLPKVSRDDHPLQVVRFDETADVRR